MKLRIGLDLDDTVNAFYGPYLKRFGQPKKDAEITRNVNRILIKDRDFWMNLPVINRPNFQPTLYCTKRVHNKSWSKRYLEINNLPVAPIYQVYCQAAPKSPRIKGRLDVFVDDSISNFIEMNLNGVPCLLMDGDHNKSWGPVGRVFSLNVEELEDAYELFRCTMFPYFKELVYEFNAGRV